MDVRVDPERVRVNRVAKADVAACSLREASAGQNAKGASHVLKLPMPLFVQIIEDGDSRKRIAAGGKVGDARWACSRLLLDRNRHVRQRLGRSCGGHYGQFVCAL